MKMMCHCKILEYLVEYSPSCLLDSMCYVVFNEGSHYVETHTSEHAIQEGTTHMKCSRGMVQSNQVTID
jgi:hypothetical protein